MHKEHKKIFIDRFSDDADLSHCICRALDWVGASTVIRPESRIFVKPNLTWRVPTPGVTVTPLFLKTLVENLLPLSHNITIGESEGGQACFQAEEAFESHGLYALAKEYGIRVLNLSKTKHEAATTTIGGRPITVELPSILLNDVDVFITAPLPKIHAMTGVSLGFKNQWGCLGDKMRVKKHPYFARTILAVNKLLKPKLCIFDGTYFLDYTGPMMGKPVMMNLVICGEDVGTTTRACCEVMQVDPMRIRHLRLAHTEDMMPRSLKKAIINRDISDFKGSKFQLRRSAINYIHICAFRSVLLNRLFYDSKAADFMHEILWWIRRNSLFKRALYGPYGPGEA